MNHNFRDSDIGEAVVYARNSNADFHHIEIDSECTCIEIYKVDIIAMAEALGLLVVEAS